MPINWHDKAVQDRLLTAVIASVDNKISVAEIARLYGGDMTYHAVENYLRRFRREAKQMNGSSEAREVAAPSPAKAKVKTASDVSPSKAGVKTGRVTKKNKKTAVPVKPKHEVLEDEFLGYEDGCFFRLGGSELDEDMQEEV